jgi:hypothetical protein
MPHLGHKSHLRRIIWVVIGEGQSRFEEASLEYSINQSIKYLIEGFRRSLKYNIPLEEVVLVL